MDPQRLVVQAVCADDHRGRQAGCLRGLLPRRDQLAITGEDDGFWQNWRDICRDLPTTVVVKRLGDEADP